MKKLGFTLSEILVAMGIIAVIAAMTAPMLDSIIPDKNKAKVLKVYKTLSSINADLLGDSSIYIIDEDGNCSGIDCKTLPANPKYNNAAQYSGDVKYCYLLADKLSRANSITQNGNTLTFDTTDGLHWTLACTAGSNPTVTIKTDDSTDCQYGTCNDKKYNSFAFNIKNSGSVSGGDPLTKAFLMNPTKLNDKKTDLAKAETLKPKTNDNENGKIGIDIKDHPGIIGNEDIKRPKIDSEGLNLQIDPSKYAEAFKD